MESNLIKFPSDHSGMNISISSLSLFDLFLSRPAFLAASSLRLASSRALFISWARADWADDLESFARGDLRAPFDVDLVGVWKNENVKITVEY